MVAGSHLGREQMIITGERQRDNSTCMLGGAISHLNVKTCCVRQLCCFKISFVSLIQKLTRLFLVTFNCRNITVFKILKYNVSPEIFPVFKISYAT